MTGHRKSILEMDVEQLVEKLQAGQLQPTKVLEAYQVIANLLHLLVHVLLKSTMFKLNILFSFSGTGTGSDREKELRVSLSRGVLGVGVCPGVALGGRTAGAASLRGPAQRQGVLPGQGLRLHGRDEHIPWTTR